MKRRAFMASSLIFASLPEIANAQSPAKVVRRLDRRKLGGDLSLPDPVTIRNRQRIIDFGMSRRIPVVGGWATFAQSGALFTYGPRLTESYRRAAYYADRILKGAKPAELAVERPTVFELVVNLRTANALGITLPQSLLLRTDEVIQ